MNKMNNKLLFVLSIAVVLTGGVIPPVKAQTQCDACVTLAVREAGAAVTSAISSLSGVVTFQLSNIGLALSTMGATNATQLSSLQTINSEGFQNLINENHVLHEKIETLGLTQTNVNEFGSVSNDLCFEVTTTAGRVSTDTPEREAYITATREFNSEVRASAKSGSVRRKLLREFWPDGVDIGGYFSGDRVLDAADMELAPMAVHLLSQKNVYPRATPRNPDNPSQPNDAYIQLQRERDTHIALVESQIADSITRNANVVDAAEYVEVTLSSANENGAEFVKDGRTSEAALIRAIGSSSFGSQGSAEDSSIFGSELTRKLIAEIGKANYIEANNNKLLSEIRFLEALNYSKEIEDFYELKMINALDNLN